MLGALGRFVVRRRVAVLVAALLGMVVAGPVGVGVAQHLTGGGFEDPGAESTHARELLEDNLGARNPNLVLVVTANDGSLDSPATGARGRALSAELAAEPEATTVAEPSSWPPSTGRRTRSWTGSRSSCRSTPRAGTGSAFGLGLALAVILDATLMRAALVPAFMGMAGKANWWAPGPLRRLHGRFGIAEGGTTDDERPAPAVPRERVEA